jgi:hypothetical protein
LSLYSIALCSIFAKSSIYCSLSSKLLLLMYTLRHQPNKGLQRMAETLWW